MKKVLVSLILGTLLIVPVLAGAQPTGPSGQVAQDEAQLYRTINTIINWAFAILLIGAVLVIIYAAFLFLTAGGDADKVKTARSYIVYALVAIVVGFLAKAIVSLVGNMLGMTSGGIF